MGKISPAVGQRYISESEPELGLGIIFKNDDKTFEIIFASSEEHRTYSKFNAPLRRVIFEAGDEILHEEHGKLDVIEVFEEENLLFYHTELGVFCESNLSSHIHFNRPEEKIFNAFSDSVGLFNLRLKTMQHYNNWKKFPNKGLIGGRINLLPHQLFVANKISNSHKKKFILADEVGLGKTIEAALLIHKFLLSGSLSSVLIVVPDALVNQWFIELFRKFNLIFKVFNKEVELFESGNPFSSSPLSIVSINLLRGSEKAREWLQEAPWEMLVVDEAHQIRMNLDSEVEMIKSISEKAYSTLFLSATPEHKGSKDHFERLNLLDPASFRSFEEFNEKVLAYEKIGELIEALEKGDRSSSEEFFGKDSAILKKDDLEITQALLALAGPGKTMIRNTRKTAAGAKVFFPKRNLHHYELDDGPETKLSFLAEFLSGKENQKVLLICKSKQDVLEIEEFLKRNTTGIKIGLFHSDLSLIARDRQAAYFHDPEGCNLLLCTEIGSEGRNFEFCHELVLFDLPARPDLIEQRIGRLDRIGQRSHINIHVPFVKGSSDHISFVWLHDGLNIFEKYRNYSTLIFEKFNEEISGFITEKNFSGIEELIPLVHTEIERLESEFLLHRDYLMEKNSFDEGTAKNIVSSIENFQAENNLEDYLELVFYNLGVDLEELEYGVYYIRPNENMFIPHFPNLTDDGLRYTFDRKTSLEREDIHFMSWEHPLVQGVMELIISEGFGSAQVSHRDKKAGKSYIECFYKFFPQRSGRIDVFSYIHPRLERVLTDSLGAELTQKWDSQFLTSNSSASHQGIIQKLSKNKEKIKILLDKNHEYLVPKEKELKDSIIAQVKGQFDREIEELSLLPQNEDLAFEMDRLKTHRDELLKLCETCEFSLDALRIIV